MTRYRRAHIGSTYFFTLVSFQRRPVLCEEGVRAELRDALRRVKAARPFRIDAWVLMPDHLHCIWTLPDGDRDYSTRWAVVKRSVSRFANDAPPCAHPASLSRRKHRDGTLWQRRFFEHQIRDERDFERHADYIHFNPVRHGHATNAAAWPFSTFHRYVRAGIYPLDWGGTAEAESMWLE